VSTVDVVIPCRDEEGSVPGVLAALPDGYRAIVVDNGFLGTLPPVSLRTTGRRWCSRLARSTALPCTPG